MRNRGYYLTRLALVRAAQHNLAGGCASAEQALQLTGPVPASARIRTLLGTFHRRVAAAAPYEPAAAEWLQHTRTLMEET